MRVLVVDDEPSIRSSLRRVLRSDFDVTEAADGQEALERIRDDRFDLILTDLRMPRMSGLELLQEVRRVGLSTPVVILTAVGSVRDCVEAMRLGASDFVSKPFDSDELRRLAREAVAESAIGVDPGGQSTIGRQPAAELRTREPRACLVGRSAAITRVTEMVEDVAATDATVLITGESGTGKEVIARLIHATSRRAGTRFVAIDCGAVPEGLIESEFFGHVRGAFTGASERRPGRFVEAHGGTLFLDEIGELPLPMQVRLLRVLQEREVLPVGGGVPQKVDVRVIAATNRDLGSMVASGGFRTDLYYRLNVIPIALPPLREREDDVLLLARHFMEGICARLGKKVELAGDAAGVLRLHTWPGNVRELANVVERLVIMGHGGVIHAVDVMGCLGPAAAAARSSSDPAAASSSLPPEGLNLPEALLKVERTLVDEALRRAQGNRQRAADLLGINRTTLVEKLKRLQRLCPDDN